MPLFLMCRCDDAPALLLPPLSCRPHVRRSVFASGLPCLPATPAGGRPSLTPRLAGRGSHPAAPGQPLPLRSLRGAQPAWCALCLCFSGLLICTWACCCRREQHCTQCPATPTGPPALSARAGHWARQALRQHLGLVHIECVPVRHCSGATLPGRPPGRLPASSPCSLLTSQAGSS